HLTADVYLDSKFCQSRGFYSARFCCLSGIGGVDHMDMVRLVLGHELVAAHAVQYRVHNRPFFGGVFPTSLGFFFRQLYCLSRSEVAMKLIVLHINPAPNDRARLTDSL